MTELVICWQILSNFICQMTLLWMLQHSKCWETNLDNSDKYTRRPAVRVYNVANCNMTLTWGMPTPARLRKIFHLLKQVWQTGMTEQVSPGITGVVGTQTSAAYLCPTLTSHNNTLGVWPEGDNHNHMAIFLAWPVQFEARFIGGNMLSHTCVTYKLMLFFFFCGLQSHPCGNSPHLLTASHHFYNIWGLLQT